MKSVCPVSGTAPVQPFRNKAVPKIMHSFIVWLIDRTSHFLADSRSVKHLNISNYDIKNITRHHIRLSSRLVIFNSNFISDCLQEGRTRSSLSSEASMMQFSDSSKRHIKLYNRCLRSASRVGRPENTTHTTQQQQHTTVDWHCAIWELNNLTAASTYYYTTVPVAAPQMSWRCAENSLA